MLSSVSTKTKAVITLFLLSPILAELLSGSSTFFTFFNPLYFLLQAVSYGIPALVIRELAIRWKLGISGMFILALGYGVFNEGLLAHTFLLPNASFFMDYGFNFGLNWAWMPFAAIWHSLHSVVYPILITCLFYPSVAEQPWLAGRTVKILFSIAFLESLVLYFAPHNLTSIYFFVFWAAIFVFAFISKKLPKPIPHLPLKSSKAVFFLGAATVLFYFVLIAITKTQTPLIIFWAILIGFVLGLWALLKKKQWTALPAFIVFACGDYVASCLFAILGRRSLEVILTNVVLITGLLFVVKKASSKKEFL